MNLTQKLPGSQRLDIAADRHLGHRKQLSQLSYRGETTRPDMLDYALPPDLCLRRSGHCMLQSQHLLCESLHVLARAGPSRVRRVAKRRRHCVLSKAGPSLGRPCRGGRRSSGNATLELRVDEHPTVPDNELIDFGGFIVEAV